MTFDKHLYDKALELEANRSPKDREYEAARNRLIPDAERYANKVHGYKAKKDSDLQTKAEWRRNWTQCFLAEMDRLAKKAGLVR